MTSQPRVLALLLIGLGFAANARAQRYSFEQRFPAGIHDSVEITTSRGEIRVIGADTGEVVVRGTVTVRAGWDVPADAAAIAQRVAAAPPVSASGSTIELREPADDREQSAVTVSYDVSIPRGVQVRATSESGALHVQRLKGPLIAQTESGALSIEASEGDATIRTGSGGISVEGVSGRLRAQTQSGAIGARAVRGGFEADSGSGSITATVSGGEAVRTRTQSSAVVLEGVSGPLDVSTQSGKVRVSGTPRGAWTIATGSGAIEVTLVKGAAATLDATTGSGSISADAITPTLSTDRRVRGTLAGGGAPLTLSSRSGSIRVASQK